MKFMLSLIAAWLIGVAGLSAAFGFELPKVTPDKGAPYRFGHHYDYDNAGSSWNHERVYRDPGLRHHYSRWYYHYGHKPKPYKKHRSYPYKTYSYSPGLEYSRHKYTPKGDFLQNFIQLRDRIPSHSFKHTRSYNRVRIGR